MKSVKQELSDAVRIAEKAAEGSALAGGLTKQDGKLNFVVVIASGDHLKEVVLEPPRVGRQGKSPLTVQPSQTTKSHQNLTQVNVSKAKLGNDE